MSTSTDTDGKKYLIDMCRGPLLKSIILFALPLMLSYILQQLFNMVDLIVIGHYAADHRAMASIGATSNLNAMVLNLFIGFSSGANVVAAHRMGAKDMEGMSKAVHTSMALGVWGGLLLMVLGLIIVKPALRWMETPPEIIDGSCIYLWICFLAIPFIMIYNFGCSILRAVGDTKRPLYYLVAAGIVNVLLNLFFVIVCKMDVAGVAIATAISHGISAILVFNAVRKLPGAYKLVISRIRIDRETFKEIIHIGLPAGIQGCCFSLSNLTIQASINSFGSVAIAAATAVIALEGLVYVGSFSFHLTAISFTAQNLGGRKYKRVLRSAFWCYVCAAVATLSLASLFMLNGKVLLPIINPDPAVVAEALVRMRVLMLTYCLCGLMDVASGVLRGLGYSTVSAVVCLTGACAFRVIWVFFIFPLHRTMTFLLISYPISWFVVVVINTLIFLYVYRKLVRTRCPRVVKWSRSRPGTFRGLRFLGWSK